MTTKKAIIIDLDGTLINNKKRALSGYLPVPKEVTNLSDYWKSFFEESLFDDPNFWCYEIVNSFVDYGYEIVFLTGRSDTPEIKSLTTRWLDANLREGTKYTLFMRPHKDQRADYVIKRDIVTSKIMPNYFLLLSIDDLQSNVEMFRELGIPSLFCGDFK